MTFKKFTIEKPDNLHQEKQMILNAVPKKKISKKKVNKKNGVGLLHIFIKIKFI